MGLLVLWLIMGGVVAVIASAKGFDTFAWLVYGALIWPIAPAHVIVRPAIVRPTGGREGQAADPIEAAKSCPECAETIKAAAVGCRFCGNRAFPEPTAPELSGQDAWLASLQPGQTKQKPRATMWQKLWWNPNGGDR